MESKGNSDFLLNFSEDLQKDLKDFFHITEKNNIALKCSYYQYLEEKINKEYIFEYVVSILSKSLIGFDTFIIHCDVSEINMLRIFKDVEFIKKIVNELNTTFCDKLDTVYIYEGGFIFVALHSFLAYFLHPETLEKIKVV